MTILTKDPDFINRDAGGPSIFNFNRAKYQKSRAAFAATRLGTANTKVAFVGMSTTRGLNASFAGSPVVQAAKRLKALGYSVGSEALFGGGGNTNLITNAFDSRVQPGSWIQDAGVQGLGGGYIKTSTGTFAFTPTVQVDTFDTFYARNPSTNGQFSMNINGGSATAVDARGVAAILSAQKTATLGNNTLNLVQTGGQPYVAGIHAYNSAVKEVTLMNMGRSGMASADLISTLNPPFDIITALPAIAPHLVFLECDINDWINGVSLATYKSNLQSFITTIKPSIDIVLYTGNPTDPAVIPAATQQTYIDALYDLSQTNDLGLLDFYVSYAPWATFVAAGMTSDAIHPSTVGYADKGIGIAEFLRKIM